MPASVVYEQQNTTTFMRTYYQQCYQRLSPGETDNDISCNEDTAGAKNVIENPFFSY